MKVKVTKTKVFGPDKKMVPVGTIIDIEGDEIPAMLVNKVAIVEEVVEEVVEKKDDKKTPAK